MKPESQWIVTADARAAHLYSCMRTPRGELRLDLVRSLENGHEGEHERHRPNLIGGGERRGALGRSSGNAAPHSVSPGHEVEEEHRRFVREVKGWLNHAERELNARHVTVFAAPRVLGMLREQIGTMNSNAHLREGELTQLSPQELSVHPAVKKALDWTDISKRR